MHLSPTAIDYTVRHLFRVAFPHTTPTIAVGDGHVVVTVESTTVLFPLLTEAQTAALLAGKASLIYVDNSYWNCVPLFTTREEEVPYSIENQQIKLHCDLLTPAFLLLSRWEEWQSDHPRDSHGRFLLEGSLQQKYDCISLPMVDGYAMLLRQWVCEAAPTLRVEPRTSHFISTHDIDILTRFGGLRKSMRTLLADLLKYRSFSRFRASMEHYKAYRQNFMNDPYIAACNQLYATDHQRGHDSIFFVKGLTTGEEDCTYDIGGDEAVTAVRHLQELGATVGLHGSYQSALNADALALEKERIEKVCGQPVTIGRQHYLRCDLPQTLRCWQSAGITDDYTLGFAEFEGFRCGTCHPYPLYDIENDRPTSIIEHPLIVMDTTLVKYRQLSPYEASEAIIGMREACEAAEGDFVLLWHNTSTTREYWPWYLEAFCKIDKR